MTKEMSRREFFAKTAKVGAAVTAMGMVGSSLFENMAEARARTSLASTNPAVFTTDSQWNKMVAGVPVDSQSNQMIGWLKTNEDFLHLGCGGWSLPDYVSSDTDPLAKCSDSHGNVVYVHIPSNITMMTGNDQAIDIIDPSTNQNVQMFNATKVSDTEFTCQGLARYWLDSNGLAEDVAGGTVGNYGHRGIPGAIHAIRLSEISAGVIPHRLKFAISGPGEPGQWGWGSNPIFPMDGYEKGHGSGPAEGVILRLKSNVDVTKAKGAAQIVAQCLKDYGAILGDTGGHATIKMQLASSYPTGINAKALSVFSWDDYEFVSHGAVL